MSSVTQVAFLDADVLLDFFLKRIPWYADTADILVLVKTGRLAAYTSPLIIANIHFVLRKELGTKESKRLLENLCGFVELLPLTANEVSKAFDSFISDFEDAIQNAVAESSGKVDAFITRNVKDYRHSTLHVLTPAQFLKHFYS